MTKPMLALFSVFLLATVAIAQESAQHPIDKAVETCIEKNGSTAGMVECTDKACCVGQGAEQKLRRADAGSEGGTKGSAKIGAAGMDQVSGYRFQVHRQCVRYDEWHDVHSNAD